MVTELGDGRVFLRTAQAAVEAREGHSRLRKTIGDMGERLAGMDEDQLLLLRITPNELDQGDLLATPSDRGPALGEPAPTRIGTVSLGDPRQGARRRGRGGAGRTQQMMQDQALTPYPTLRRHSPGSSH